MKRRSDLSVGAADWGASVGTNGRHREEDVIPSGAASGVEESVDRLRWMGGWVDQISSIQHRFAERDHAGVVNTHRPGAASRKHEAFLTPDKV